MSPLPGAPTHRSVVMDLEPLLYWRFNDSGTTECEDRSGHGRSGEYRNEAAQGAPGLLEGDPDTAVLLDEAKASYIKALSYNPFIGVKTFEIWAKRKAAHEKHDVFFGSSEGGGSGVYAYIAEGTDNIRLSLNGFGTTATWEHAWPGDEVPVHIVFVLAPGGKSTLYVNGVNKGEKAVSAYGEKPGNVRVSHDNATGGLKGAFGGVLDEFAIYEGALTAKQVDALYESGSEAPGAPRSRCLWGADMDGDVYGYSRRNLAKYGDAEAGIGWETVGGKVLASAFSGTWKFVGSQSFYGKLESVAPNEAANIACGRIASNDITVTPGTVYSASLRYNVLQKGAKKYVVAVNFYDSGNAFISRVIIGESSTIGTGRGFGLVTAPAGATHATVKVGHVNDGTHGLDPGEIFEGYADVAILEAGEFAGAFEFPTPEQLTLGSVRWDGLPSQSTSSVVAGQADAPYGSDTWDRFEEHAGRDVGIVHFSDEWKAGVGPIWDRFGKGASDAVRARGAIPMKTIGGPANVLSDTLSGKYDAGIDDWARAAREFGDTVLLRPWWEFNLSAGSWTWSGTALAATHLEAWRYLYARIKAIAPNVLFVWCPNVVVAGTPDLTAWFPGEDYVDWMAMDGYSGQNPLKLYGWRSAHKLFRSTYDHLQELAPGKPVVICETAASEFGGSKSVWIRNLLGEAVQEDMPQIRALVWFNWNIEQGAGRMDWPIESSLPAQAAFEAGISSSFYGNPLQVETEPATLPLPTRAELHGLVDPGGVPAVYWFEYGLDESYGSETPHRELGPLGTPQEAAELVKGLKPGRTYHFRLVAENELGQVVTDDLLFVLARAPQLHVRELMPLDVLVIATSPGGKQHRWAEDGPNAGKIIEGMTDSGSVPGGDKGFAATLPRRLGIDYGDMKRGTMIEVFGAGQMPLSVYRLGRAPQVSGDKLVVSPDASGYEVALLDDNTAQEIFIDADQSACGETSARRRAEVPTNKYTNAQVQLLPAGAPDPEDPTSFSSVPAISHSWTSYDNSAGPDVAESWYDSNGVELGEVLLDFEPIKGITPGDVNWNDQVYASIEGVVLQELLADLNATATTHKALSIAAGRYFLMLRDYYGAGKEAPTVDIETQWRNVRVRGRNGLPLYGNWPQVGVLASDVAAYVLARWCPQITFTTGANGTIKPSNFIIPHLAFKGPTNAAEMIQRATRFELPEWGVWLTSRGPTFFMNPRGQREGRKRWRVRASEAEFEETGQQMDLVWNGAMVEGQGTDGATLSIGPTGCGLRYTTDRLLDSDPSNPVNELGEKRYAKVQMRGIATLAGMVEAGEAFLEHCRLLDASGKTTLPAYIEDERGKRWPYYCANAGDEIEWIGSSVPDYRYVVNAERNRGTRSSGVDIDAPPDSFEAMMERLGAEFVGVGFESG